MQYLLLFSPFSNNKSKQFFTSLPSPPPPPQKTKPRIEIEFVWTHAHCDYKNTRGFACRARCDRRQRVGLCSAEAGSTCCSCAQFWRSFGRGCNCPLLLSHSLCFFGRQEMKFNRMLKPAEELHVSCLMFRRRVESTGKSVYTQPWAGVRVDLSSVCLRCCRIFVIALSGVRSKFAQLHPVLELQERRCTCCRGSG